MVSYAVQGNVDAFEADRIYDEVRESINRQFDEIRASDEQIVPMVLRTKSRHLFRTRPGHVLRILLQCDVPSEEWLSPTDMFGRLKLARYKQRTDRPVTHMPDMTWGRLNRIVAKRSGGNVITFQSAPRTKESWYATDDPYIAALIREWIDMAQTPQYSFSDFRHVYEVDQGAFLMVAGKRFTDDEQGWAMARAYAKRMGVSQITMGTDDDLEGEVILGELAEDYVKTHEMPEAEARELFTDNLTPEEAALVTADPVVADVREKKARGRKKKADPGDVDMLDQFEAVFEEQRDFGIRDAGGVVTVEQQSAAVATENVAEVDDGDIAGLIDEFIEVNSGDNDARSPVPDDSQGAGRLP